MTSLVMVEDDQIVQSNLILLHANQLEVEGDQPLLQVAPVGVEEEGVQWAQQLTQRLLLI
jgi:hypothetical protein